MFRSKCRWIENGERPTKYFLILKNEISTKKTTGELRLQDGSTTKNEKLILNHIEAFYKVIVNPIFTPRAIILITDLKELLKLSSVLSSS